MKLGDGSSEIIDDDDLNLAETTEKERKERTKVRKVGLTTTILRGTAKVSSEAIENTDSIMGGLSYVVISWASATISIGNYKQGGILMIVGMLLCLFKHRIPAGSWSKFIKLPPGEIKRKTDRMYEDIKKTFLG